MRKRHTTARSGGSRAALSMLLAALAFLTTFLSAPGFATERPAVRVGFAQQEIGSIARANPDYTFRDTLYAKVIWVEDGEESFGIVSLDMISVNDALTEAIRRSVSESLEIPSARLIVCPSHTHSSLRPPQQELADLIGSVARTARDSARPAWVGYSRVEVGPGFVVNRRITINEAFGDLSIVFARNNRITEDGKALDVRGAVIDFIVHGAQTLGRQYADAGVENPRDLETASPKSLALLATLPTSMPLTGPVDAHLEALSFRDESGKVIGTLVRFACHPTSFRGSRTLQYSADYPGVLCEVISEATGGAPAHFVLGPCGNTKPFAEEFGEEPMVKMGTGLGRLLATEMEKAEFAPLTRIYWEQQVRDFPVAPDLKDITPEMEEEASAAFSRMAATAFDPYELKVAHDRMLRAWAAQSKRKEGVHRLPFTVIGFNDVTIATMPGEVFAEHGLAIKDRFPGKGIIVTGITDTGSPSYVPTRDAFARGGYGVGNSALPAGAGERMVEILIEMLDRYYE